MIIIGYTISTSVKYFYFVYIKYHLMEENYSLKKKHRAGEFVYWTKTYK